MPTTPQKLEMKNVFFSYPDHYKEEKAYLEYMLKENKIRIEKDKDYYLQDQVEELERILNTTNETKEVLKNISISVEAGKIVALVGRNGSGS